MALTKWVRDGFLVAAGGYIGELVMGQVSMKLYQLEPEAARRQEDQVRPGPPAQVAAEKINEWAGLDLNDSQVRGLGTALHLGLGPAWMPVYLLLRRRMHPGLAAVATGASMTVVVDEALTPLLGFSAPNRAYPLVTHLRGLIAHVALGVVGAAVIEGGWQLLDTQRSR